MVTTNKSRPIFLNYAARLVSNFLEEPKLQALANISLGGTFPVSDLYEAHKGFTGTQFWFCYNALDAGHPRLFVALEKSQKNWDPNDVPNEPETTRLNRPVNTFTLPAGTKTDPKSIETFLSGHTDVVTSPMIPIHTSTVKTYSRVYRALFGDNTDFHCEYPLGFFVAEGADDRGRHRTWIQDFMDQQNGAVKFVRYYFGFEDGRSGDDDKPNRIRIILVPVNAAFKNIIVDPIQLALTGGDGSILQKSFPPPPAP